MLINAFTDGGEREGGWWLVGGEGGRGQRGGGGEGAGGGGAVRCNIWRSGSEDGGEKDVEEKKEVDYVEAVKE